MGAFQAPLFKTVILTRNTSVNLKAKLSDMLWQVTMALNRSDTKVQKTDNFWKKKLSNF